MDIPDESGKTKRQILEFTNKRYGLKSDELTNDIPFPSIYSRSLEAFYVLARSRVESNAITLIDIKTYMDLYHIDLSPFEIDCIQHIDFSFIKYQQQRNFNTPET